MLGEIYLAKVLSFLRRHYEGDALRLFHWYFRQFAEEQKLLKSLVLDRC